MTRFTLWPVGWIWAAGVIVMVAGCGRGSNDIDPCEKPNRFFYALNEDLDRLLLKPGSDLYVKLIPGPVRTGVSNGLDNLGYANVILNDLLQGKWGQALGDTGRMAANSTIGIAGIFDVASNMGLPAHRNDFGITLGRWGAGAGPYLVLPLLGPSTVRDVPGLVVSRVTNPVYWIDPPLAVTIPLDVTSVMDTRFRADAMIRLRAKAAIDPYIFTRDAYLRYRWNRIHEGQPAPEPGLYDQDTGPTTQPASQPAVPPEPELKAGSG